MFTETATVHPAPQPHPPTGLTSAHAAVYAQLVASPGTTAADIAIAAGVGRSTAGKALAALEQRGLASRTPGDQHNGRCLPDRWHPTEPPADIDTEDEAATAGAARAHDTNPAAESTPAPAPASASASAEEPPAPQHQETEDTEPPHAEPDTQTSVNTELARNPEQQTTTAPVQGPTATATSPSGGQKSRLAPGALRRMVIDHLTAHPAAAFTATGISRAIEKSSGAIANCLVTLVAHGLAEQVSEKPRTYRLATTRTAGTE